MMGWIQEFCVNARPNCKTRVFCWKYICPCKRVQPHMFSFTNQKKVTWRGRGAGVKNKIQGAGPFFGQILVDDLQRLAPHRKKVASPGRSSIDRTWWDEFKNFVSMRAQIPKHLFSAENTFVLAKGYKHICSASPTKKVTSRGRGAGVKNKIQGAGPFFGQILVDDLQRLAPHRKKVASPGRSSIDRTWWDEFKNFVSTRAQIAKHVYFAENTFVHAKGYKHICSASPTQNVSWKRSDPRFNIGLATSYVHTWFNLGGCENAVSPKASNS